VFWSRITAAPLSSTKRKGLPLGVFEAREVAKARWAARGYCTWISALLVGAPSALLRSVKRNLVVCHVMDEGGLPYTRFGSFELCKFVGRVLGVVFLDDCLQLRMLDANVAPAQYDDTGDRWM
jgi:hypothetical protein